MLQPQTLVDAFRRNAAVDSNIQHKDFPIIYFEDGEETRETVADLYNGAREYLGAFQQLGLKRGDYVILQIPTRAKHFRTFWACALGGIIPVTVAVPLDFGETSALIEKIRGVVDTLSAVKHCVVLTENSVFEQLKGTFRSIRVFSIDQLVADYAGVMCAEADVHASDVLFLQLTSGSTGIPKCIQLTHDGIINQITSSAKVCGYGYGKTTLNWLPFDHVVPMLTCHLRDIYLGMGQVQIPTQEVLENPILWIDCLEKYMVNFSWSPNFGYAIVSEACKKLHTKRTWDLNSIEFLLNAGEQVTRAVCEAFIDSVGIRASAMQPSFGMAESCTCITFCTDYSSKSVFRASLDSLSTMLVEVGADEPGVEFMDLGKVIDSVEIRITAADGVTPLPENVIGRLQIRGSVVTPGYVNRPAANHEAFVAEGWFDSGDLGFLRNGRLHLTGRRQETINIRGTNLFCYEIESQVSDVDGILPSYVAATSVFNDAKGTEDLLVFFTPDDAIMNTECLSSKGGLDHQMRRLVKDVQRKVTRSSGISPKHCIPVLASKFHKTTSGKIQRSRFRSLFLDGHYDGHLSLDDEVPKLLQSSCFHRVWDPVETSPAENTDVQSLRVQLGEACAHSPLTRKLGHILCKAGHTVVSENPDVVFCLADIDNAPISACDAASRTITVIERIDALFQGTKANSRFWVLTPSASGFQNAVTSAVHGWMRSLAMERPERKPTILMWDLSLEALRNIPSVLSDVRFDAAREMSLVQGDVCLATLRRESIPLAGNLKLSSNAAYLITGGTGALGLELAKYLVRVGARSLVLLSRRGEFGSIERILDSLRKRGTDITVVSGDVSVRSDVESLVKSISRMPEPLKGVFHLAGVYDSCLTRDCSVEFLEHVFRAKAKGAALLHECITSASFDLDHFVFFSSIASTIGPVGYAAYAAANSFLDGLADVRRHQGVPALSLQWGPWDHIQGMAGDAEFEFFNKIVPFEGMTSMGLLMQAAAPTGLILNDFNFSSYSLNAAEDDQFIIPHLLMKLVEATVHDQAEVSDPPAKVSADVLRELAGDILGFMPAPGDDLISLGFDSAGIMRFIASLKKNLKVRLPLNFVFTHPTIDAMAKHFHNLVEGGRQAGNRYEIIQNRAPRQLKEGTAILPKDTASRGNTGNFPLKKRCLVLHGEASNANLMRVQMQMTGWIDDVGDVVEFIFVDAPHLCKANVSLHNTLHQCGMYDENNTYFGWGLEPHDTYITQEMASSEMLHKSIEYVHDSMKKHAPIHGIAGVCDGALLASYVAAHGQGAEIHPITFLVNFCSPPLHRLPPEYADQMSVILCLNMHFLGLQDELYCQEDLLSIPRFSKHAIVCYHDGGHVIPMLNAAHRALVTATIEGIRTRKESHERMGWINSTASDTEEAISEPDTVLQIDSKAVAFVLHRTKELLKNPNIGLDSPLFDSGITSLEAIQLVSLLAEVFKREVSPTALLKHSTLREILSSFSAAYESATPSQSTNDAYNSSRQDLQNGRCHDVETMIEKLDFDTRMLGIPTARVLNVTTPMDLRRAREQALSQGLHLLCLSLNEGHPLEEVAEPHRVCTKVTYANSTVETLEILQNVVRNRDASLSVEEFASDGKITNEMIELAVQTGTHSRYNQDPLLGHETMVNVFETWLRNSAKRAAADHMLVASIHKGQSGETVVGYITCKIKVGESGTFGDITLMACNPEYSNLGVTWHLLHSAIAWFGTKGIERVESSTHLTNDACKAMFEIAGMQISRKSHDYHMWLQPRAT